MKHWKIIFVCLMLTLSYLASREVYFASLGPDAKIQLDSNHYLEGWPGFIVQYRPDGSSDVITLSDKNSKEFCPSGINKYAVSDKYIVAKAKEGWLAIDRRSLQIWGCYETISDLEAKIGESVGNLNMIEEFSPSNVYVPPTTWYLVGFTSFVFIVIMISVLLLSALFKRVKSKRAVT